MKSKRLLAVMLSGFMVFTSMTPVFTEEIKSENTNDNSVVSEEQKGNDVNNSEEVKDNEEAVITDKDNEHKTAQDEKKAEESTSLNETSKTVKSTSKTALSSSKTTRDVLESKIDETTGLEFSYDSDTNEATITGLGSFPADDVLTVTTFAIPSKVKTSDTGELTVTAVGGEAFLSEDFGVDYDCTLIIPSSIESIGKKAFSSCYFAKLEFEEGSNLTTIGEDAFKAGNYLENLIIPKSVVSIEMGAFYDAGVSSLTFEEGSKLESIKAEAFRSNNNLAGNLTIPKNVTYLGFCMFTNCRKLESITFEEGINLETLEISVFDSLDSLKEIVIPKSVKTMKSNVFSSCDNLSSIIFEEGSALETLERGALKYLPALEEIIIPEKVTSVGDACFQNCTNLKKIVFMGANATIGTDVFKNTSSDLAIYAHTGKDGSLTPIYTYFEAQKAANPSWTFGSICHGPDEVAGSKVEPTCGVDGTISFEPGNCTCGNVLTERVTFALPATQKHTFDKTVISKEATCTVKGSKHRECSVCGDKEDGSDVDIPMLAHTYAEIIDTPATCTEEGSKHSECSVCNTKKENSDEKIGVLPHTFDKEVVDKEATYTEEGSKHTECSVCGTKKEGSDVVIPKIVKEEDKNNNNNGDSTSNGSTVTKTGSDKTAVNNPQTSDEMNMVLYVLLGLVSLGAVGTVGYKLKKRNI
ncbi:leucine-rich repeat domain-containing protein [Anaerofustis stercorihominis]